MKFGAKLERTLTKQITEQVTRQVTEQVTQQITEQVTRQVTEQVTRQVTEQVTRQVLDGLRSIVVTAVRNRFGRAAAVQAQAFITGIKSGDALLSAYHWALTSRSRSELLDRLGTV